MPIKYGSQQNIQGENWSTLSQGMDMDERERLRNRFGNSTFWQGHDDRIHTQARGSFPVGNPFDPRPEPYTIPQQYRQVSAVGQDVPAADSHQQAGQSTGHGQQPHNNQYRPEWLDDEGYSSGEEQAYGMSRPQNTSRGGHQNTPQGASQGQFQGYSHGPYQYAHGDVPEGLHNENQGSHWSASQGGSGENERTAPQSAHHSYERNSRSGSHRGPRSSFF